VPLTGEGLKAATGDCPNPLYAPAAIQQPLKSKELKTFDLLPVPTVYEYDVETQPGQTIQVKKTNPNN
jgi:alpha-L-fucosidase 2